MKLIEEMSSKELAIILIVISIIIGMLLMLLVWSIIKLVKDKNKRLDYKLKHLKKLNTLCSRLYVPISNKSPTIVVTDEKEGIKITDCEDNASGVLPNDEG